MSEARSEPKRITPRPTAVSEPYWAGCAEGELRLQQCDACGCHQFYPRLLCGSCGATALSWRTVSGAGRVATWSVVRRGVSKAYEAPYVVALIDLDEGPRMMSQIVGSDVEDPRLAVGARVKVEFLPWADDVTVPVFRLEDC